MIRSTPLNRMLNKTLNQQITTGNKSIALLNTMGASNSGIMGQEIKEDEDCFIVGESLVDGDCLIVKNNKEL